MAYRSSRKRRRYSMMRKRVVDTSLVIDYKKPEVLKKFITERGKIIPARVSGATHRQQLAIVQAVKRARYLALIPSSIAHEKERGFMGEMSDIAQTFAVSSFRKRTFDNRTEDVNENANNNANNNDEDAQEGVVTAVTESAGQDKQLETHEAAEVVADVQST